MKALSRTMLTLRVRLDRGVRGALGVVVIRNRPVGVDARLLLILTDPAISISEEGGSDRRLLALHVSGIYNLGQHQAIPPRTNRRGIKPLKIGKLTSCETDSRLFLAFFSNKNASALIILLIVSYRAPHQHVSKRIPLTPSGREDKRRQDPRRCGPRANIFPGSLCPSIRIRLARETQQQRLRALSRCPARQPKWKRPRHAP